jgi:hypothetical protein
MATYNLKFNKDDSVIRHIIVGLLADLNNKVFYHIQRTEDNRELVKIPFHYAVTGSEAFLYDNFLQDVLLDPDNQRAMGNYNKLPIGIVNMTSLNVDSASLINKYVRGTYVKEMPDQTIRSFISQFQMIPVTMNFDVTIKVDSNLDQFKIAEALIKTLYKNNQFNIDAGTLDDGTFRLASYYKFPEDQALERPMEFGFTDEKIYTITFSIEMLSFIPSFEKSDEQYSGNRMFDINQEAYVVTNIERDKNTIIQGGDSLFNQTNQ